MAGSVASGLTTWTIRELSDCPAKAADVPAPNVISASHRTVVPTDRRTDFFMVDSPVLSWANLSCRPLRRIRLIDAVSRRRFISTVEPVGIHELWAAPLP